MRRIEIQYTSLCNTVLKKPLVFYVVNTNSQCFHIIYDIYQKCKSYGFLVKIR